MANQKAIEVRELKKVFKSDLFKRRVEALKSISFHVEEGEVFGFVGHNGAGKTTTIKTICGLIFPDSGSVEIFGVDFRNPASRKPMGFLPEHPYFYDYLTAREALMFYGGLSGMSEDELNKRIPEVLSVVHLDFAENRRLRTFSKGMLQRLGMAQALIHDPKLLILDEPMSGLDPIGRKLMRDIIIAQKEKGKTVFFSSHVLSDVEEISDRVGIIIRGEIRAIGEIHELLGPPEYFEFGLKNLDATLRERLEKFGDLMKRGEVWYLTVKGEQAKNDALAIVNSSDVELITFNAKRKTLEELFVEAMHTN